MRLCPEKVEVIVLACCSLHNYLRSSQESKNVYTPIGSLDTEHPETHEVSLGNWRTNEQAKGWKQMEKQGSNRHSGSAKGVRDYLTDYFNSIEGAVPWQDNMV